MLWMNFYEFLFEFNFLVLYIFYTGFCTENTGAEFWIYFKVCQILGDKSWTDRRFFAHSLHGSSARKGMWLQNSTQEQQTQHSCMVCFVQCDAIS